MRSEGSIIPVANPFSPRFGVIPTCMVERSDQMAEVTAELREGP